MTRRDQRTALMGWSAGAVFAVGAYVGAIQFFPAAPTVAVVASLQQTSDAAGVDPIQTGSIGSSRSSPSLAVQNRIDRLTLEVAALRESVAASQAATLSTNRRLEDLEQGMTVVTASISQPVGEPTEQPLPALIEPAGMPLDTPASQSTRLVLPAPLSADGGQIAVSMRPLFPQEAMTAGDPMDESALAPALETESTPSSGSTSVLSQTPFAVDIGGASTLDDIDALWVERVAQFGSALDQYSPRILLQQTNEGTLELRLVAGPIDDAADAALACARLVAAGLERCLPAIFDGQQLALR